MIDDHHMQSSNLSSSTKYQIHSNIT